MNSIRLHHTLSNSKLKSPGSRKPSIGVANYEINNSRSSLTATCLTLYSLMLIMCGGILPIIDAISNRDGSTHYTKEDDVLKHRLYLEIFYLFIYTSSILALIYLCFSITYYIKKTLDFKRSAYNSAVHMETVLCSDREQQHHCMMATVSEVLVEQDEDDKGLQMLATQDENSTITNSIAPQNKRKDNSASCLTNNSVSNRLYVPKRDRTTTNGQVFGSGHTILPDFKLQLDQQNVMRNSVHENQFVFSDAGVNLYLRLGAVGFGLGVMIRNCITLGDYLSFYMNKCPFSLLSVPRLFLQLVFVFVQTFFMFKYHKIVVNFNKPLIRFIMTHLTVTNICRWLKSVVVEIADDFKNHKREVVVDDAESAINPSLHNLASKFLNSTSQINITHYSFLNETFISNLFEAFHVQFTPSHDYSLTVTSTYPSHFTTSKIGHTILRNYSNSYAKSSCASKNKEFAHYLFPCTIEYSLIAAAIFYRLFQNIGHAPHPKPNCQFTAELNRQHKVSQCHKSHKGLFTGLLYVIVTLASLVLFYTIYDVHSAKKRNLAFFTYLALEICLLAICSIASVIAIIKLGKLAFRNLSNEESLDYNLLLVGLSGQLGYNIFLVAASIDSIPTAGGTAILYTFRAGIDIVQSLIQVILIFEASRKCAGTIKHMQEKPGRAIILFLLVSNFSMWTLSSFVEIGRVTEQLIKNSYYSTFSWIAITRIFQPLIIFYRFHSTVCLSNAWNKAYQSSAE